jgi:glycerophosphoryl diester phosphodiesterase
MLVLALAAREQRGVAVFAAARYALLQVVPLLALTALFTLRVLVYLLPYLFALGAAAWFLISDYDINYYLSQRPPEFLAALGLAAALSALLAWLLLPRLLGWCLVMPLVLFEQVSPAAAFAESERRVAAGPTLYAGSLLRWLGLAALLGAVPALVLNLCTGLIVGSGDQALQTLVVLLGLAALAWSTVNIIVGALVVGSLALLLVGFYRSCGGTAGLPAPLQEGASRVGRPALLAVSLAVLVAALGASSLMLGDISTEDHTLVVAHRGAAGAAPENTLAAVRQALADGADWVEIDVQETRDGEVIVVHDSDFMKLAGNPLKVWEGDLATIRNIDVGSWFDDRFAGERVPTLAQVLDTVRGKAQLVIELKYYGHDEQLEQRVVDIVEARDMVDQVAIMSLKLPGIQKLKALRPDWSAGLLAATSVGDLTQLDVDFLAVNQNMATNAFVKRAHGNGKDVFVWTVNDGLTMSRYMSMGVDGVITDEPALAGRVIAQRRELGSGERLLLSLATLFGRPEIARQYRDSSP